MVIHPWMEWSGSIYMHILKIFKIEMTLQTADPALLDQVVESLER
jgi:hypothetical protein